MNTHFTGSVGRRPRCARETSVSVAVVTVMLLSLVLDVAPAAALPVPVAALEEQWTPTRTRALQLIAVRMELTPSLDDETGARMWIVDETSVVRNQTPELVTTALLLPNAWSAAQGLGGPDGNTDFWGEVYVNGQRIDTEVVGVSPNPAHPGIAYRAGRQFTLRLDGDQSAHVRMRYALPAERTEAGEERLSMPFRQRALWDGAIDFGVITVRWMNRMYALRTNLASYSSYGDRVEWFLRAFEPEADIEIRFLPHASAFAMVSDSLGCPTVTELVDRLSDSEADSVAVMLDGYPTDVLAVCAALPAAMAGSARDARDAGLDAADLSRFAPPESGINGPLVTPEPSYDESRLSPSERMYRHYLLNEVARRR